MKRTIVMVVAALSAAHVCCCIQSGTMASRRDETPLFYKANHVHLEKGVTAVSDIVSYLGPPTRRSADDRVYVYLWNERPTLGSVTMELDDSDRVSYTKYLILEFDDREVLRACCYTDSREGSPFSGPVFERHPGPLK